MQMYNFIFKMSIFNFSINQSLKGQIFISKLKNFEPKKTTIFNISKFLIP